MIITPPSESSSEGVTERRDDEREEDILQRELGRWELRTKDLRKAGEFCAAALLQDASFPPHDDRRSLVDWDSPDFSWEEVMRPR